jgi:hypothetical protein
MIVDNQKVIQNNDRPKKSDRKRKKRIYWFNIKKGYIKE